MKKTVENQRRRRFDEINSLVSEISVESEEEWYALPPRERQRRKDKFWDCLWDWLIDGWAAGLLFVGEDKDIPDLTYLLNWVYPRGESVSEIFDRDVTDPKKLQRMIECEANRVFNSGVIEAGKGTDGLMKTWETMMDDRVRDSHWWLEGVTIPFDEEFVTFGGASAPAPGMFDEADQDVNCRCYLTLSRGSKQASIQ